MTYNDLITIVPSIKKINSPNIAALGKFRYNGNFTGTFENFKLNGTISTAIGGIYGQSYL